MKVGREGGGEEIGKEGGEGNGDKEEGWGERVEKGEKKKWRDGSGKEDGHP